MAVRAVFPSSGSGGNLCRTLRGMSFPRIVFDTRVAAPAGSWHQPHRDELLVDVMSIAFTALRAHRRTMPCNSQWNGYATRHSEQSCKPAGDPDFDCR